jgi:predicted dehydrogenase
MMNRRRFLETAASTVLVSSLSSSTGNAQNPSPSAQINLGVIGVGSRGQEVMRSFLRLPGVKVRAICDVYEPRFAEAQRVLRAEVPTFRDYRKLLEARELDAVVVATPLYLHAEHVIASLDSGRHVYGEKDMAMTVAECDRIVETVKRSGKKYQVGLQYHYAPWYIEGLRRIRAGKIGKVTHVFAYWHRNNDWRRPVPDPKDEKLERLINWRMYREYSGGLLAELGSHHLHFASRILGGMPESVTGMGGIVYWKDGREVPDTVQVIYQYSDKRTLFFSSICSNHFEGAHIKVYGTEGTITLTQAGGKYNYEPKRAGAADGPEGRRVQQGLVTGASYRAEQPYTGPAENFEVPAGASDPTFLACQSFVDCIRNNQRPQVDEIVGRDSGAMVALGNLAIESGTVIKFGDHVKRIEPV